MKQWHFYVCSPLCCSPRLLTEQCPDFPEEEKPAAPCASAEVQKLRGETTCSQLRYMHLAEITSISCNSSSYLCRDTKGDPAVGRGMGRAERAAQEQTPPSPYPNTRRILLFCTSLALRFPAWGTATYSQHPQGQRQTRFGLCSP